MAHGSIWVRVTGSVTGSAEEVTISSATVPSSPFTSVGQHARRYGNLRESRPCPIYIDEKLDVHARSR